MIIKKHKPLRLSKTLILISLANENANKKSSKFFYPKVGKEQLCTDLFSRINKQL